MRRKQRGYRRPDDRHLIELTNVLRDRALLEIADRIAVAATSAEAESLQHAGLDDLRSGRRS